MKCKKIIIIGLIALAFLSGSGCDERIPESGDVIVPPVTTYHPDEESANRINSSGSLNNLSNIGPLAQPSTNMIYTMLDRDSVPVSLFADNKYLYLLRGTEDAGEKENTDNAIMSRYGNVIQVHDVENGSFVREISDERMSMCSAFTVKESNVYAFDIKTGQVLLFSSGGSFLASYDTGLAGVYAEKIIVSDNRCMIFKIREDDGYQCRIAICNPDAGTVEQYTAHQLRNSLPAEPAETTEKEDIVDFCLFDEESILVVLSGGRLSLFNVKEAQVEKSCVFPITAGFVEYEGNVLYYAADIPVFLSPDNVANFTNVRVSRQIGRMLINKGFSWPQTEEALEEWILNDLPIRIGDDNGRHVCMSRNTKYLFFLDFIPVQREGDQPAKPKFMVYRTGDGSVS